MSSSGSKFFDLQATKFDGSTLPFSSLKDNIVLITVRVGAGFTASVFVCSMCWCAVFCAEGLSVPFCFFVH